MRHAAFKMFFEKDGLEAFTNTPLYSLLIQSRAARSELHGQAFSPALFYKVGRAGLDAGGGGGEREKKRNRGKEGTPAGWAEGEAEAKLGAGAAAPARACGRARVTRRARATRVPRRPAAAAAAARSAPGSALARPRRGAGAVGAARAAVRPGVFVREPRSAPLRMSLCVSPGKALGPRGAGGVAPARRAGRPPARSSAALRRSPCQARCSRPSPAPFPPFGTPSPSPPPTLRLPAWARLSATPPSLTRAGVSPASSPGGTALGLTCCLFLQPLPLALPPPHMPIPTIRRAQTELQPISFQGGVRD